MLARQWNQNSRQTWKCSPGISNLLQGIESGKGKQQPYNIRDTERMKSAKTDRTQNTQKIKEK